MNAFDSEVRGACWEDDHQTLHAKAVSASEIPRAIVIYVVSVLDGPTIRSC